MKYKVIFNGKRIVPEPMGNDMVMLKHTHNKVVYARRIEVMMAKKNHTVNRQIMLQKAHDLSYNFSRMSKKEKDLYRKDIIHNILKVVEQFEKKNKIISNYRFGDIIKDVKSTNTLGLLLYEHMSEEQIKGFIEEIDLFV